MHKGRLFILSGPSGSGKDTLLSEVLARRPEVRFSISCITRPMRGGEVEGQKYHFISRAAFEQMLARGEFLEHNLYVDNYYGTPRAPVEECIAAGGDIIVEIDVNGAAQIREKCPEAVSIFIMPPSFKVLRERLTGRGTESPEMVEQRLQAAVGEIARAGEYDYIVINGELESAVCEFLSIIDSDRCRYDRRAAFVEDFLAQIE